MHYLYRVLQAQRITIPVTLLLLRQHASLKAPKQEKLPAPPGVYRMKVYVLFSSDHECANIIDIYSSRLAAFEGYDEYITKAVNDPDEYPEFVKPDFVKIKEWDVKD
jgi:hypothetical protein